MHAWTFLSLVAGAAAAATTTLPQSAGSTSVPTAIPVSGSYDGGMKRFERNRQLQGIPWKLYNVILTSYPASVCQGQSETGEKDAMFILENGATLSNVIIGKSQAEGVHCKGTW